MPWWSINPRTEPAERKEAAWALFSSPSEYEDEEPNLPVFSTRATALADAYNNAENLGLDLNSLRTIPYLDDWDDEDA
ncbi:hypothetical protein [Allocoleopsis franciscana]|uniref:Uncharacterized protein n=1 Tax=Allocoleopsis franciscana PCC 7113 TaxID=1173027 RepID=K9WRI0_9CYAN|nr:hypothetical protein [Allocoleopsis franciscana]AFZ22389.1 hypothetical protein Mic7113_6832 [Allocoleopsis franciscana PCC 7113]